MILWHCDLRCSQRTQIFNLLGYSILFFCIILLSWSDFWFLWIALLIGLLCEIIRNQKRLSALKGQLSLHSDGTAYWQAKNYQLTQKPFILEMGILLYLKEIHSHQQHCLWLANDSMPEKKWRSLRQILLQPSFSWDAIHKGR